MTTKKKWNSYAEFLKSDEWGEIRERFFYETKLPVNVCQVTGKIFDVDERNNFALHHWRYQGHWEDTKTSDLILVCKSVHMFIHDKKEEKYLKAFNKKHFNSSKEYIAELREIYYNALNDYYKEFCIKKNIDYKPIVYNKPLLKILYNVKCKCGQVYNCEYINDNQYCLHCFEHTSNDAEIIKIFAVKDIDYVFTPEGKFNKSGILLYEPMKYFHQAVSKKHPKCDICGKDAEFIESDTVDGDWVFTCDECYTPWFHSYSIPVQYIFKHNISQNRFFWLEHLSYKSWFKPEKFLAKFAFTELPDFSFTYDDINKNGISVR